MRRRHVLVTGIAFLLCLMMYSGSSLLLVLPTASAHAYVIGSDPIDGSTIEKVPDAVHIYFNAPISSLSQVLIYSIQQGALVDVTGGSSMVAATNARELITPVRAPITEPEGGYEVVWSAVSSDDGHTSFGRIGFNVGFSSTGLSGTSILGPSTSNDLENIRALDFGHFTNILGTVWEWFALLALTLWLGIVLVEHLVLSSTGRSAALLVALKKRTASLQWLCLATLFFGELVSLILRATHFLEAAHGDQSYLSTVLGLLTQTSYGYFWLTRITVLAVALILLAWTNRSRKRSHGSDTSAQDQTLPATPPIVTTEVASGVSTPRSGLGKKTIQLEMDEPPLPAQPLKHRVAWLVLAAVLPGLFAVQSSIVPALQPHISAIVFSWLNLLTQGVWFGGFAYLGMLLLPLFTVKEMDYRSETLVMLLRRLIPFLCLGICVYALTTLFLGEASISAPQQFLNDPYGRTLLVQIGLLLLMIVLSLYALFSLFPRLTQQAFLFHVLDPNPTERRNRQVNIERSRRGLRRVANMLSFLGAGVLLCVTLLAFFTPPIVFPAISYNNQPIAPTPPLTTQTKQLEDLSVTLQVLPAQSNAENTLILLLNDGQGKAVTGAQVRVSTAMVGMNMGTSGAILKSDNGVYSVRFDKRTGFTMSGLWTVTVEIQRANHAAVQGTFQVMVA